MCRSRLTVKHLFRFKDSNEHGTGFEHGTGTFVYVLARFTTCFTSYIAKQNVSDANCLFADDNTGSHYWLIHLPAHGPAGDYVYSHATVLLIFQSQVKYVWAVACKCQIPFSISRRSYKYPNNERHLKGAFSVCVIAIELIWLDDNLLCFYLEYISRELFLTVEVDSV